MNSQDALLEAWKTFVPPEPPQIFYRLYHDEHGNPLYYSMQHHEGQYIEITQEQYNLSSPWVRVQHGRLIEHRPVTTSKLRPSDQGTLCHELDVCIVVDQKPGTYWQTHG